MGGKFQVL